MPEAIVESNAALDRLLLSLRLRMEQALQNHQRISMHARAGIVRGSFSEEDGSFDFWMRIEPKP